MESTHLVFCWLLSSPARLRFFSFIYRRFIAVSRGATRPMVSPPKHPSAPWRCPPSLATSMVTTFACLQSVSIRQTRTFLFFVVIVSLSITVEWEGGSELCAEHHDHPLVPALCRGTLDTMFYSMKNLQRCAEASEPPPSMGDSTRRSLPWRSPTPIRWWLGFGLVQGWFAFISRHTAFTSPLRSRDR